MSKTNLLPGRAGTASTLAAVARKWRQVQPPNTFNRTEKPMRAPVNRCRGCLQEIPVGEVYCAWPPDWCRRSVEACDAERKK